jgi:hypothetical protein
MSAGGGSEPGPETFEGRLFRMGKGGTIALVVVIVAALAGAGILAGALAGQSTPTPVRGTRDAPMLNPGGSTATGSAAASPRTFGRGFRPGGLLAAAGLAAVPGALPQISPSPVEGSPVEVTPTPTQTPITPSSTIDLDGVPLPVPDGWGVLAYGPNWARITNGHNFVYAEVDSNIDPASDVPQLTRGVYQVLVGGNPAYSGLPDPDTLSVDEYQPFGGLVGRAGVFYFGIYTDQQAAYDVAGQLYLSLRQDGKAMVLQEEVVPMLHWDAEWEAACLSLYRPVVEAFAGESYPYDPCG